MKCELCPRGCGVDRGITNGVCGVGNRIKVARAALHFWEEPCISGNKGSGAVFFSGCALHCIYCQNRAISDGSHGVEIEVDRLVEIFFGLSNQGANNINLVTGDHYIPEIAEAINKAKKQGFDKPFIFNCSGYERAESLKYLDGLIDVYLPDFKYMDAGLAKKYSNAEDYPEVARSTVSEMVRQRRTCLFNEDGVITSGVIVRHMLLPGNVMNARQVVRYLHENYGNSIYISLLSQYTPMVGTSEGYPELGRRVRKSEYDRLVDYALKLGVENAYIQDMDVAKESFIPQFNYEGVIN